MMVEPVSDAELQAFIDGQLDTADRIEVERRLQADPEAAAAAMEGLRLRDELRLFMDGAESPAPAATVAVARELSRRLGARRSALRLRRALAAGVLLGVGWFAHAELGLFVDSVSASPHVPAYAGPAVRAIDALSARPAAAEAPTPQNADGAAQLADLLDGSVTLLASTPVRWEGGSGVAALYRGEDGRLVGLFAGPAPAFDVSWPTAAMVDGHPTVFWQSGPYAYALSGGMSEAELLDLARRAMPRPWASFIHSTTEGVPHG